MDLHNRFGDDVEKDRRAFGPGRTAVGVFS